MINNFYIKNNSLFTNDSVYATKLNVLAGGNATGKTNFMGLLGNHDNQFLNLSIARCLTMTYNFTVMGGTVTCLELQHPNTESDSLLDQINAWLSDIVPGTPNFNKNYDIRINARPSDVGFGLSFNIAVIKSVLKAKAGDTLLIENPETGLHPQGQVVMGYLLACAAISGIQIFVETHSDHLINAIRICVKKGKLTTSDVNILHFSREWDNPTTIESISIDSNGELSNYPPGLLDQWTKQLMELL